MEIGALKKAINKINDLPTLPVFLLKLSEVINDPHVSVKDLGKIIEKDQVQTSRLLKLVNSAFYGFPRKIGSVTDAIVILGFEAIKNLCLSLSIFDLFATKGQTTFDRKEFWKHSIGCAIGSKIIAKYAGCEDEEELFVAGLLHDIGKVVLDSFFHDDFMKVVERVDERNTLIVEAEEEILKFTHAHVGRFLAERWKLTDKLVYTIAFHHRPTRIAKFAKEASIVHIADVICRAKNIGSGGDRKVCPLSEEAWDELQLRLSALEPIMEELDMMFEETASILTLCSESFN